MEKATRKIKLYLQSLDFKFLSLEEFKMMILLRRHLIKWNKLDETMFDFHKFLIIKKE